MCIKISLYCFVLVAVVGVTSGQYCTNFGDGGAGNFPGPVPALPTKYQTRVEIKSEQDAIMTEMRLYYDYFGQRAAAEIVNNMKYTRYIFNYATNEIYELQHEITFPSDILTFPPDERPEYPTTCVTHTLTDKIELAHMFGFIQLSNQLFPDSPAVAFRFAPQAYNGLNETRGIKCDSYISCIYDPVEKSNYTVVHYFSQNDVVMPGSDDVTRQVPVRAVFNGVAKDESGNLKPFTKTYDYHEFSTSVSEYAFKTPSSVFCPNRKVTKQAPKIEKKFGFSMEISTSVIQQIKNFYQLGFLTTFELRNYRPQEATYFSTNPIIYVYDNSFGVEYAIDKVIGNCSIRPFRSIDYDNVLPEKYDNALAFIARIQATQQFLDPDQTYVYTGDRVANGIPSYRFMANISSDIYEYTFSDDDFFVTSESSIEQNVPVTLYLDSPKQGHSSHSTFYNYVNKKSADLRRFEMIGSCFKPSDKLAVDIIFPYRGQVTAHEIRQQQDIESLLLGELYEMTKEDDVRFRRPIVSAADDGNMYVRFEILPPPPPLATFTKIESSLLDPRAFNSTILDTAEQCALFCLSDTKCLSFDYSFTKYCHLNNGSITDGTSISDGDYFDHYTRNVVKNLHPYRTNMELYQLLKEKVSNGQVYIDIFVNRTEQGVEPISLQATEIKQINVAFGRFGSTTLLRRFKNVLPNSKLNKATNIRVSGVTIDQCAQKCSEELGAPCQAFEFCYLLGSCQLSESFAPTPDQTDLYSPDNNCDIYNKNALAHYNFFPAKANINKKDLKYVPVGTVEECAAKCDREKKVHCRSFNFCPGDKACYLSESHSVDAASSGTITDLICDHYSRRYIEDFVFIGKADIKVDGEIMLNGADLDQCSMTCVTAGNFDCKTFDYCEESRTCLINSGQVARPQSAIDDGRLESCSHYRREFFPDTSRFVNLGKGDSDSSESLLLGLSLGFGTVAIFSGLLGTVHFFKKRVLKTS